MSDSGCYLLDDNKECIYPDKRQRGGCSGLYYTEEAGYIEEEICPYYWFWEDIEEEEDVEQL